VEAVAHTEADLKVTAAADLHAVMAARVRVTRCRFGYRVTTEAETRSGTGLAPMQTPSFIFGRV
jgi:hypothetical protein